MSGEKSSTSASVFDCLPLVIGLALCACLGVCGKSCQDDTLGAIRATARAVRGEP